MELGDGIKKRILIPLSLRLFRLALQETWVLTAA